MLSLRKLSVSAINALFITTGLLYFMFLLIDSEEPSLKVRQVIGQIPWSQVREETPPKTGFEKPTLPKETRRPEPIIDHTVIDIDIDGENFIPDSFKPPKMDLSSSVGTSQLVLAIGFPPSYPNIALTRGIEGYAVVGFSVGPAGAVYDAHIIESEPNSVFDRSALKAIKKFKYKPRHIDGKAVSTTGQRYMFTYELDE